MGNVSKMYAINFILNEHWIISVSPFRSLVFNNYVSLQCLLALNLIDPGCVN